MAVISLNEFFCLISRTSILSFNYQHAGSVRYFPEPVQGIVKKYSKPLWPQKVENLVKEVRQVSRSPCSDECSRLTSDAQSKFSLQNLTPPAALYCFKREGTLLLPTTCLTRLCPHIPISWWPWYQSLILPIESSSSTFLMAKPLHIWVSSDLWWLSPIFLYRPATDSENILILEEWQII